MLFIDNSSFNIYGKVINIFIRIKNDPPWEKRLVNCGHTKSLRPSKLSRTYIVSKAATPCYHVPSARRLCGIPAVVGDKSRRKKSLHSCYANSIRREERGAVPRRDLSPRGALRVRNRRGEPPITNSCRFSGTNS